MKKSGKYLKIVEWSEEDQCYIGTCPGLMIGGVHGDDEAKVYKELCQVVEEWIEIYEKDGEPPGQDYSGKLLLHLGKDLHRKIAIEALRTGQSINSYIKGIIDKQY